MNVATAFDLRINPNLNIEECAARYARQGFVQIPNFFAAETAAAIEDILRTLPWRLICQDHQQQNVLLTQDRLKAMSSHERRALASEAHRRAADNIGYMYLCYPMIEAAISGWDNNHPIHAITHFLNSPTVLDVARGILANPSITKIDAQASAFQPGHFLTRHRDHGDKCERRAAYTIGFTRGWQPDWGGLLMFLNDNMDVTRAFLPRFNTLTVFDGLATHSVSTVSPFAPRSRLSIVGWFRDDRPAHLRLV